jgi:hypothetical protein
MRRINEDTIKKNIATVQNTKLTTTIYIKLSCFKCCA